LLVDQGHYVTCNLPDEHAILIKLLPGNESNSGQHNWCCELMLGKADTMSEHPRGSFEFIDHTADAGIRVKAPTVEDLFATAALAFSELVTRVDSVDCRVERRFKLQEDDIETLLVSWLQELLYLLDTEALVFARFQVTLHDLSLAATAWGDFFDPKIHPMKTEIKAVTYHQLEVTKSDQGWQAQVIFDI
jgi:SHS2 domain-containing protein